MKLNYRINNNIEEETSEFNGSDATPDYMREEKENLFEEIKKQKLQKYLDVGFTKEQAELLIEEAKLSSFGMGIF